MKIVEVDEQDKTVADHSPGKPETTDASCPPPPVGESENRPRIDRLLHRVKLLTDRSDSLVGQLRGIVGAEQFQLPEALDAVDAAMLKLTEVLLSMNAEGFECRSTVKSRAIARMRPGTPVRLVDPKAAADLATVYGEAAVSEIKIHRWVRDNLFLQVGQAISGPHRWSEVEEVAKP